MNDLEEQLFEKITDAIKATVPSNKFGIAFSGGIDSTLVAKICSCMGYDFTLLTVGFADSHDLLFADKVNQTLGFDHHSLVIDKESFSLVASDVMKKINTENLSWNENCIAFFYISLLASTLHLDTVITANGIDELFCGYNAYRDAFDKDQINQLMNQKLENELDMMKAVNMISLEHDVTILQPLLLNSFIHFAKKIPLSAKITSSDDLLRKHIIRSLAKNLGISEISYAKRKKALQYGTKIHKQVLKLDT